MADTELISVVNFLARKGATRSQIEWFTSSFDDYDEAAELVANYNAGVAEATIDVTRERTYLAEADIRAGQDCNDDRAARLDNFSTSNEDRWDGTNTRFAFVGPPTRVRINATWTAEWGGANQGDPGRAEPTGQAQRSNDSGRTWINVGTPAGCYVRMNNHSFGHASLYVVDSDPGFRPQYRLWFGQGNPQQAATIRVAEGILQTEAMIEDQITILKF